MLMYMSNEDTIIFDSNFNKLLNMTMKTKYKKIIFSDWILNRNIYEAYINNNLCPEI